MKQSLNYPNKSCKRKEKAKSEGVKKLKTNWEEKLFYGLYLLRANNADVAKRKPTSRCVAQDWKLKLEDLLLLPKIKFY